MRQGVRKSRETIVLALVILVVQAVLSFTLNRYVAYNSLQRDSHATQQMLQSVYQDGVDNGNQYQVDAKAIEAFGKRITALPGMVRSNIYSADRFIRFSSDQNLTGIKFVDNAELEQAFAGQVVVSMDRFDSDVKAEHLALGSLTGVTSYLIEAYIPLRDKAGTVEAVVEYYKKADDLQTSTNDLARVIWLAAALAGAAILLGSLAISEIARKTA